MMERDGRPRGPTPPHPSRPRPYYIRVRHTAVSIVGAGVVWRWVGTLVIARPVSILYSFPSLKCIGLDTYLFQKGEVPASIILVQADVRYG
jgi:hypothetical protein